MFGKEEDFQNPALKIPIEKYLDKERKLLSSFMNHEEVYNRLNSKVFWGGSHEHRCLAAMSA